MRLRLLTGAAIFLAVFGLVGVSARAPGLTWDEAIYCRFAVGYLEWFQTPVFDAGTLTRVWGAGQVHPPLGKLWLAGCLAGFGDFAEMITAARLGAGLLFGATAAALFLWLAGRRNLRVGLMAALAFVLMPRMFAHGHLANLGMPSLFLWVMTVIAFERGIHRRGWSIACGVLFGCALLTKVDGFFLPVVLLPWGLLFHGRKAVRNLIAMAVAGPVLFLVGWPALWHDPVGGVGGFFAYWGGWSAHKRTLVSVYYLGRAYTQSAAPWHYAIVMVAVTTPLAVVAGAAAGVACFGRKLGAHWRERGLEALILGNALVFVLLFSLPGVGKYDGVRLMLPSLAFLACFSALGAETVWQRVRGRGRSAKGAGWALAAMVSAWLVVPVWALHPYQLCYYNELVGGPWGAHRIGFETTYWNDTVTQEALDFLNAQAPANARVARLAVGDMVWRFHQVLSFRDEETGKVVSGLRRDLRDGDFDGGEWDFLVVCPRRSMLTAEQLAFMAGHRPVWVKHLPPCGRLPICLIYRREGVFTTAGL